MKALKKIINKILIESFKQNNVLQACSETNAPGSILLKRCDFVRKSIRN